MNRAFFLMMLCQGISRNLPTLARGSSLMRRFRLCQPGGVFFDFFAIFTAEFKIQAVVVSLESLNFAGSSNVLEHFDLSKDHVFFGYHDSYVFKHYDFYVFKAGSRKSPKVFQMEWNGRRL